MSLIQSAKLNGHDPYRYLKNVLKRLPTQPAPYRGTAPAQLAAEQQYPVSCDECRRQNHLDSPAQEKHQPSPVTSKTSSG
jgi:hypothetical protein